jgi:uncharacterized protein (TIGR03084 family)
MLRAVDPVVQDLADQHAELADIVVGLPDAVWHAPTRCVGWDVSDVVLHLSQSDELAIGSLAGRFTEVTNELTGGLRPATSVDDSAALMVERQRGIEPVELLARWRSDSGQLVEMLGHMDLSQRVAWVAGELSARTLATTRLAETWIHAGDIAESLGIELAATGRLRHIARLAWRTLPYAFASAGLSMSGPVAFGLTSPSDEIWDFLPDEDPLTTVRGPAIELCNVAARRIDPASTSLHGDGPDLVNVLELVRTYA